MDVLSVTILILEQWELIIQSRLISLSSFIFVGPTFHGWEKNLLQERDYMTLFELKKLYKIPNVRANVHRIILQVAAQNLI
jgi:predicted membrane protein